MKTAETVHAIVALLNQPEHAELLRAVRAIEDDNALDPHFQQVLELVGESNWGLAWQTLILRGVQRLLRAND